MLRGARLVTAQETEEGQAWAESRIKSLTGGDPITAHFMRQDDFTFIPQFKLIIAGNHKPQLKNVDEAIRRRLHLIPFTVTVDAAQRDKDLPAKLRSEWPGILAWAIRGCLEWQRTGLNAPDSVRVATDEYLTSEDALGLWIDENCNCARGLTGKSSALFDHWKSWASTAGETPGSAKAFKSKMETKGFRAKKYPQGIMFEGVALTAEANDRKDYYREN
jgi:putative DNA primase/helicase